MNLDFFPKGIAKGNSFIGCSEEIKALNHHIQDSDHTLLVAPESLLKSSWHQEYKSWTRSDLSSKGYVYWWADGIIMRWKLVL